MAELEDGSANKQDFEGEFENALRTALRPRPAPQGFVERVLQSRQLAAEDAPLFHPPQSSPNLRFSARQPWLRWGAAACLLLTGILGGLLQHRYQRQQAGERARRQVLLALRITGATLQDVRSKIYRPPSSAASEREQ